MVQVTYSELDAFHDDVASLAVSLENESQFLEEAAEAVGTPFGDPDLKSAIEYFHQDWNTARDALITSLEDARDNAQNVAEGWRNLDSNAKPSLPDPPVASPIQE
ncbi:hypothetical protein [Ruania alba]|uniref:Uncharacterized protein n=1 Tax=Ruania alba TaxID=648782 RepID=A0A1H5H2V2_9MICO|nr:hypothetical protein [Ruania alba]SEE22215.1 hypothetical protein SAMN04488554_1836 [Ruania alba]